MHEIFLYNSLYMLSYIHAYHAGNSGDILKHTVFAFTLLHLLKKDKPFTVIDSHSGEGKYTLSDERLKKTGEAEQGIKKLLASGDETARKCLGDELFDILEQYTSRGFYPGSPEIARCFLREKDFLFLNELHPKAIESLRKNIREPLLTGKNEEPHIKVSSMDAAAMLKASVPPLARRGCVIIDPSYEDNDDFELTARMFYAAYKKWRTATYLIWYPLLRDRESGIEAFKQNVLAMTEKDSGTDETRAEFYEITTKEPSLMGGHSNMYGSGMIAVNPPYGLDKRMETALPLIEKALR